MSKFFDKFPLIDYPGLGFVRDFTPNVTLKGVDQVEPYKQAPGTRPDAIASRYYGDPVLEWLLYQANDIDNPRDLICLTDDQFNEKIRREYGSLEAAEKLTDRWRHNWRDDLGSNLTPAEYDSLAADVRPLFDVQRDFNGNVTGYVRKKADITKNTNLIYRVAVADSSSLTAGQVVEFADGPTVNGRGQIATIVDNDVFVHHIVDAAEGTSLGGVEVEEIILTATNISATQAPFYERVSVLQHLRELNDARQDVKVVDKRLTGVLERQLSEAFE